MSVNEPSQPSDPRVPLARQRTSLASYRTTLALDRTMLAWIRTTLTMASFGFGLAAFFRALARDAPGQETARLHQQAVQFGIALLVLSLCATVLAGASHWLTLRRLLRGDVPVMRQWPLSVVVAYVFALLCLVGLWALLSH